MDMQQLMDADPTVTDILPILLDGITMYEIHRCITQQFGFSDLYTIDTLWMRDGVELSQEYIESIYGENPCETFLKDGELLAGLQRELEEEEEEEVEDALRASLEIRSN